MIFILFFSVAFANTINLNSMYTTEIGLSCQTGEMIVIDISFSATNNTNFVFLNEAEWNLGIADISRLPVFFPTMSVMNQKSFMGQLSINTNDIPSNGKQMSFCTIFIGASTQITYSQQFSCQIVVPTSNSTLTNVLMGLVIGLIGCVVLLIIYSFCEKYCCKCCRKSNQVHPLNNEARIITRPSTPVDIQPDIQPETSVNIL